MELDQTWALFLVVFLGLFHVLGGGAVGRGLRAVLRSSDNGAFFVVWGAGMGFLPLIFDWFFLIAQGYVIHGLVGPFLFGVSFLAGAFLETRIESGAIISTVLGSGALLLGLFSIPLMLNSAEDRVLGLEDYAFGSCFVLLFVLVGGSFAWIGFSAMVRGLLLEVGYGQRKKD